MTGANSNNSGEWAFLLREIKTPPDESPNELLVALRRRIYQACDDLEIPHAGSNILPWWMFASYAIEPWCRPNGDPYTPGFRLATAEHQRQPRTHRRPHGRTE
jgi:hypothetical protein